ncbi:Hypothetical predicted protein [Mytilus galloprovincialis]|uniref:Uncharacterized protein n=1 Tax=Mytilus galloprovincialis TaxID=29158 RepID=A0A8B6D828_MYTGA|nr:Hypothetical predicted protein [Mytilus galloprovincialis]
MYIFLNVETIESYEFEEQQSIATPTQTLMMENPAVMKVLEVCAASKRKNLAGLDSFMKAGNDAFVTLEQITRSLEGTGLTESLKDDIKDSKRESQCEWFGKRGLNWHVTAVCKKEADTDIISVQCYVHLFDSCTQNWFAVASILEHVLKMMKEKDSSINEAFVRSDNAGCYKCAPLLISIPGISLRIEVNIKRYDFSDAQGGKDICDRRIAPIKQHIKAYANEGNNVRTASDMKKAIESYGGIANTFACVALIASDQQTLQKWKWPGVSDLSNFQWSDEG